jgi:D-arabinose 1-dehydrogenase-like Zn-dependent alcohol dehydrogenase
MRAALLAEYDTPLEITDVADPTPTSSGVVLRVDACGVCRSDWHVWKGDWRWRMNPRLPHIVTSAFHGIVNKAHLAAGETMVVFGCGGLGLAVVQIGVALGARVIAVDRNQAALDHAKREGAVTLIAEGDASRIAERVRDLTSGGADVTVDALGSVLTLTPAVDSLKKRGRHLQLGLTGADEKGFLPTALDAVVERELSIVGSVGCPRGSFEKLLALVERGRVEPSRLISKRISLDEIGDALVGMSDYRNSSFSIVDPAMDRGIA